MSVSSSEAAVDATTLTLTQAIAQARTAVTELTGQTIDSIVQCSRPNNSSWVVAIDIIEVPARMGDNDLLATYEVEIDCDGALATYRRLRRYHREDGDS